MKRVHQRKVRAGPEPVRFVIMQTVADPYGLHGRIVATAGNGDALAALFLEAAEVLREAFLTCRLYLISRTLGDPDSIWVTEAWTDRVAHDASLGDARVREVIQRARPLIARTGDTTESRPIGGKGFSR